MSQAQFEHNQHEQNDEQESFDNVDPQEIAKFEAMSSRWWDKEGEFKPLHDLNPARLNYIKQRSNGLSGKQVLDVGCGVCILAEIMAQEVAVVTGFDLRDANLTIANMHLY